MRLVIAQKPLRRMLRWAQLILFAGGVSLLAYCGFVLWDARSFQNGARRQLEQLRADRQAAGEVRRTAFPASPATSSPAVSGGLIGSLDIPRLGLSAIAIEGNTPTSVRRAGGAAAVAGRAAAGGTLWAGSACRHAPGVVAFASWRNAAIRFCSVRRLIPNISAARLRLPPTCSRVSLT